ncbi:retron Ec48 family effector membrane protein [Pseudomonas sp. NCCP-436]|uniref:retron Ec48 family effector membrane protein n=1 Tax=Pseudomonas sp. NCCP-436 TaxID=2842481 RepID=UPI001C7FEFCF|nr:retron Ec48 family effector membrane protein [Pseudomonas sp. NCCP-436]
MIKKKIKDLWNDYPYLNYLAAGLIAVTLIGLTTSAIVFFVTGFFGGEFTRSFCLHNACVERFFTLFEQSFQILDSTLNLLVSLATVGGIIVALMSFLNSASATALSNHISHFSTFQNYISSEISKRNRISPASVDVFVWYNLIFSNSRTGKTNISDEYCKLIDELNGEISCSNEQAKTATQGSFRYMPHQQRIMQAVLSIGISLSHQPRNEFYEIEDQIFSLINSVNKSFCYSDKVPELLKRKYV